MFSKKQSIDIKKSTQKFLDSKRDTPTRFRHLKIVLDHVESSEAKALLETFYSPVFQIFYDTFTSTESTLKQKSHRIQREELEAVLNLLEKILILLPELLQQRWQKHTLTRLFKRLLHPGNSSKLRRDAMKLFVLWYQILGEQADAGIHSMFGCLVPGFPHHPIHFSPNPILNVATAADLLPLILPQTGEKGVDDASRFYLDSLMEFMVTQVMRVEWRDKHLGRPQRCFSFLLQKFQFYFLPHVFPEISNRTNVYRPDLDISELRRLGPYDSSSNSKQPFITCRVVVLKWLANLTHVPQTSLHQDLSSAQFTQHLGSPAMDSSFYSQISEKECPLYMNEQNRSEVAVAQEVLFGTRENVNLVLELYRQGFLLPLQHSPSIRKILSLYRDWIHRKVSLPLFMLEPGDTKEGTSSKPRDSISNSSREHVCAGMQNVLQVFITHAGSVFMSWVQAGSPVLLEEQVDICKRVLNIYRYMVMNSPMEQKTWEQLLLVLLQVTSQVLGNKVPDKKEDSLGNRLAPALFQTLIVTWIRANLNVMVTTELWDQFVLTLSALTVWEELIREWAKTMDILTRVLAKNLYNLDLSDLPLDRLSEQKAKKRRAGRVDQPLGLGSFPSHNTPRSGHISTPVTTPVSSPPNVDNTLHSSATNSGQDETRSAGGSVRSRSSVVTPGQLAHSHRARHSSSGETSLKTADSWGLPLTKKVERSKSDGNLVRKFRSSSGKMRTKRYHHNGVPSLPAFVENRIARILMTETPSTAQLLRRPLPSRKQILRKRSRSVDSIKIFKGYSENNSDSETESRSPSPSSGVESNSFKDSPMQIDVMALDQGFDGIDGDSSQRSVERSVILGGRAKGWLPDVAVIMWRRMLGALGDPNEVQNPLIHAAIFDYLVELGSVLIKIRQNQGVSLDNVSTPPLPAYVPPILMLVPWCQKALTLPVTHHKGKILALRLLCSLIVRPQDIPLPRNQLLIFYRSLHLGLTGQNQETINTIIKFCGTRFFSLQLPGFLLLMLDFLHGANSIISSTELKGSSRVEAISLVGSMICFPENFPMTSVLRPIPNEYTLVTCEEIKDHIVSLVLKSAKREATSVGRCVAISSLALYIYCQLAHSTKHAKVKEAIAVLLAVLKFKNRMIGQVACDMLLLLCDHAEILLQQNPDIPRAIVEDLANTLFSLASNRFCNNQTKQLLLSLAICLGEWCMRIPYKILLSPWPKPESPSLIHTVFRVLKSVAIGSSGISGSNFSMEAEADGTIDNVGENLSTLSPSQSPMSSPLKSSNVAEGSQQRTPNIKSSDSNTETEANIRSVRLAAKMVTDHLLTHVGHFPMGIGASRLSSMVSEQDDLPNFPGDDLSTEIFQSPSVQFFMLNKETLMSMVELPTLEVPDDELSTDFQIAQSQVRLILRNLGGKACWDTSLLYGLKDDVPQKQQSNLLSNQQQPKLPSVSRSSQQDEQLFGTSSFIDHPSPPRLSVRHRPPNCMPKWEDTAEDMDNLEDLLIFIGHTSPECIPAGRHMNNTLTTPPPPPPGLSPEVEEDIINALLHQKHMELDYNFKHSQESWMKGQPAEKPKSQGPHSPFQFSRMLFSQLGFTSWDKRGQVQLLKKCDKLLRELKNLDNQKCRDTHKIAVIYVGPGQEDKNSILTNSGGSQAFEDFVAAMAWEVELETHTGFLGGLQRNRTTGETAPYFATSFTEVIFHVSTRMPSHNQDALLQKTRHLGNDEVHIVWSEHGRDYRRGIIPTEFCDVLITIYPLPNNLFRIQITRKPDVPFVGPLFNECIVDKQVLPGLVRATALNASRATRSIIPHYHTFFEERFKALDTITQNLQEPTSFEDFCAQLLCPGHPFLSTISSSNISGSFFNPGSSSMDPTPSSSGPPSSSGHVTFASDTSYSFPVSIFRHNSMQDNKQKAEQSGATVHSADGEELHYTSPKANKRLSFKNATRKTSAFGNSDC